MPAVTPSAVVFDVGGVLLDWDPRYLYRKLLPDEAAVERFLAEVCTPAWNLEQDRGRPWANVAAAQAEGLLARLFTGPPHLRADLHELGLW